MALPRDSSGSRIPKLLHQSWRDGGFPKTLFNWRWQQGLLDLNPGWRLMKWTDASSRQLIADHYPWFLATYDAYPSYIQRCDASRYFIVYHHGGVYADLDIECSKPFAPVLAAHQAVFSFKQGRNMSRGLVNALFASEARHPVWQRVFQLLANRSSLGAAAATHVDVVRSTGPGLLREAINSLGPQRSLRRLGIELLDASVWHPIMPEQKHGRDASGTAAAAIAASHCYHHFVSSWMTHDKQRHTSTEQHRHDGAGSEGRGGGTTRGEGSDRSGGGGGGAVPSAVVPVGQGIRATNPWKSYQLKLSLEAAAASAGHRRDAESESYEPIDGTASSTSLAGTSGGLQTVSGGKAKGKAAKGKAPLAERTQQRKRKRAPKQ